jgi:hypothetical protein
MDKATASRDTIEARKVQADWLKFSRAIAKTLGVFSLTGLDRDMARSDFEEGLTVDQCLAKRMRRN